MSQPREYQTEAVIIKKTRLGEADLILTMYTPGIGKIQGVARGVRKPKSKLAGHLELLTHSAVSLSRGRGSIDIITASQTINGFLPLKSDLWLSSCALYASELINQFGDENTGNGPLFALLLDTYRRLCEAPNKDLVLRYFELHLLAIAGYRPELRECVGCHRALTPVENSFSASSGGLLCPACAGESAGYPLSVNAQKVLRFLQAQAWENAGRLKLGGDLSREVEKVTGGYLEYLLERRVKSAEWLRALREQLARRPALPSNNHNV